MPAQVSDLNVKFFAKAMNITGYILLGTGLVLIKIILLGIVLVLISIYSHWLVAVGVFLMIWGNNLVRAPGLVARVKDLIDTMEEGLDKRYVRK